MKKTLLLFAILFTTAFGYTAQAVESHTVACTAGNLANLASSYLTTVTNLTVTGTIDARDFKTMRDAMPLLEVIDLSGSTVSAYEGTAGTIGTTYRFYSANGIPEYAFVNNSSWVSKSSLKAIIFPSSITAIWDYAFYSCSGLTGSLTLPASVTFIGREVFRNCNGLTGLLTIPESVTYIGFGAFLGCKGFTGPLIIPTSVNTIDNFAFDGCTGFTGSLTIPSSVTIIEYGAFQDCSGFTGSLTIPSSVTTIASNAFNGCNGFTGSLTIPASVTAIGDYAFSGCSGFTGSLIIPASVTTIGIDAFYWWSGEQIEVNVANPNYSSQDGVLYNKDKTVLIQCPKSKTGMITIPASVITIKDQAFESCSGLTGSLLIPASVTTIGVGSFISCIGFTGSLTIPSSVISIGRSAFVNCSGLTGTLTIPASVTTIGDNAFNGVSGLISISANSTTPIDISASPNVFYGVNKTTCSLHVPVGSKGLYTAANQWKDFVNIVDDIVPAPQASGATAVAGSSFTASWSSVSIATKYFLDVATDNAFTNMVAGYNNLDVSTVLSKSITGLSAGTTYYYRVRTFCALGTSGNSNVISATTKTNQLITFSALANRKYGAAPFTVTATGGASGNPVTFSSSNDAVATCTGVNGATVSVVGIGSCTIKANQLGNASFNNANQVSQSLTIDQAPLLVTANAKSRVYGTTNPTFDVTITGFVNGQTLATSDVTGAAYTSCSAYSTTPAGTAPIVVNLATLSSNNYTFTSANGLLTITKAPLTVKANDKSRVYGAVNPLFDATITGFISGESLATSGVTGTASITCVANATTPAGTANIVPSLGSLSSGNYSFNFVNGLLTITKLAQTITFGPLASHIYGDAPFTVSATGGASGSPVIFTSSNSAVAICTGTNGSTITIKGGGMCNIYANQAGNSSYNNANQVEQGLIVVRAPLVITANPKTKVFGTANPTFDVTMTNFKNGETFATSGITGSVAINCSANATTPVGTADIIPSLGTLTSESYIFYFNNGLLTITPATALENIIAQNAITLYPNPATSSITVSELSSLVSDKAITLSITDISGNTLLTKSIEPTLNSATVDVSSLSSGAYVMIIQSNNGNVVKRFLKR